MTSQASPLLMHDYTPQAKVYWWTTFMMGAAVIVLSMVQVGALGPADQIQILGGLVIAALTGFFPVRIPGAKTSVAGAEIFVLLLLLLFGPAAAALAAACEAAVGSHRTSSRLTSRLGSPAIAALAMYGCGSAFTVAVFLLKIMGFQGSGMVFGMLLLAALAYFATSTLLMASLISLKQGEPLKPWAMLREHSWLALAFVGSASISGLVYMTQDAFGATAVLVAVPIIATFLTTLHLFFRQAESDERVRQEKTAASERERAESSRHMAALQASEKRFHSAFTHAAVGMLLVARDGRIVQTNRAFCDQLGRDEGDLAGRDLMDIVHTDDIVKLRIEIGDLLAGTSNSFVRELRCVHGNGSTVWVASNGALFSADGTAEHCLIMQMQDVTARKLAETKLEHIAYHDGLTNLPNRSYFFRELGRAVTARRRDTSHNFAVMFLDFDRFKTINDSLGHGAGDELLKTAAKRLRHCLRPADFVARLGGDEFAILLEGATVQDEAIDLADRIQRVLMEPMRLCDSNVTTSASIGITTSAFQYTVPENVMRDADIALYRAKAQGKARYAMFDSELHVEVSEQLRMEVELRRAVEDESLTVAYQPIYDLRTKTPYGFEALARWWHPERGHVSPEQFIPLAEETGLIVPLGNRILALACAQLAEWRQCIPAARNLHVHANVSSIQLAQRDYAAHTLEIIRASGIPCERVTLEVTESILIDRLKCALPNMRELAQHGVNISVDDFGTGYSSLSSLEDLPIGEFKIDRSFVQRLTKSKGEAVVVAILALGRSMSKNVIVEGIETLPQLEHLLQLGCERGQGFLLGRPLSAADAEILVRESAPVPWVASSRSVIAA